MNIVIIQVCALLTYVALYSFGDIIYKMETQILYNCCNYSKGSCYCQIHIVGELYSNQLAYEKLKVPVWFIVPLWE
ncbi:hypothetical protein L2E82_00193 [Cichorium intybus]|uniref:Uncharacterized protein n=1 Tax=Cichorium intybus TaxID=13427 RepID=A0ACB9GXT1_CICIN|nr:hypothetical protein L2E82_00193 [Cichorium intybus]